MTKDKLYFILFSTLIRLYEDTVMQLQEADVVGWEWSFGGGGGTVCGWLGQSFCGLKNSLKHDWSVSPLRTPSHVFGIRHRL